MSAAGGDGSSGGAAEGGRGALTQLQLLGGRGQQANHVRRLLGTQTLLLRFLQVAQELCSLVQFLLEVQGLCDRERQHTKSILPLGSSSYLAVTHPVLGYTH